MFLKDILDFSDAPYAPRLEHAVSCADQLHKCPTFPKIPVIATKSRREQGAYVGLNRPNRPLRFEISRFATSPELTMLHEVGHFLDQVVLNRIKAEFASEFDPIFERLRVSWLKSDRLLQIEHLLRMLRGRHFARSRALIRYTLAPREIWARTYMQWVVFRSNDRVLAEQFELLRNDKANFGGHACTFQWDDEDFNPIMLGVDELLAEAGLMR